MKREPPKTFSQWLASPMGLYLPQRKGGQEVKPDMTNFKVECTVCHDYTHCIDVPPDAYVCTSCWKKREARIKETQAPQQTDPTQMKLL